MTQISPGVWRLDNASGANAYLVDSGNGLTLIDPGMNGSAAKVADEVSSLGPVRQILLTHYIGAEDEPILRRRSRPSTVVRRVLTTIGRVEVPTDLRVITDEDEVVPGIRTIASPGHTPGHRSFLAHDVLFIGDAATTKHGNGITPFAQFLHTDTERAAGTPGLVGGSRSRARHRALTVECPIRVRQEATIVGLPQNVQFGCITGFIHPNCTKETT
jgi:hydroxyacylglutathione hydrolase